MKEFATNDNIYAVGITIRAKANPSKDLIIDSYNQRIYYCAVPESPEKSLLAYYEKELIAPAGK